MDKENEIKYLQFPVIRDLGVGTLRKQRAANKKAAFGISKTNDAFWSNSKLLRR